MQSVRSILDCFPKGFKPRAGQDTLLLEIEKQWDKADVIVIGAPVACGKSLISMTIAEWVSKVHEKRCTISVPTNLLLDQMLELFPKLFTLRRKDAYRCSAYPNETCARYHSQDEEKCMYCPYLMAARKSHSVNKLVCNTYTFLAHRLYNDCVIYDEAHLLIDIARDRAAKRLWHKDYNFPQGIRSYGALYNWVEDKIKELPNDKKLKELWKDLEGNQHKILVQKDIEVLHNKEELCLKLLPLDVSDKSEFLWPHKKVKKIILMSATIGEQDIKDMGLDKRRVVYIDAPSPIPVENRPFIYDPIAYVNYSNLQIAIPRIAEYIEETLTLNPEKGFIHAPYAMALELKNLLQHKCPRLVFHDKDNKSDQYHHFFDSPVEQGLVMIGSGMYEGLSMDNDTGRWQIICKVPYMSLADPAIKYKAEQNPDWYNWSVIKTTAQAFGRICRGPNDYGATIIIDKCWERLYRDNKKLIPKFLLEAITD